MKNVKAVCTLVETLFLNANNEKLSNIITSSRKQALHKSNLKYKLKYTKITKSTWLPSLGILTPVEITHSTQ